MIVKTILSFFFLVYCSANTWFKYGNSSGKLDKLIQSNEGIVHKFNFTQQKTIQFGLCDLKLSKCISLTISGNITNSSLIVSNLVNISAKFALSCQQKSNSSHSSFQLIGNITLRLNYVLILQTDQGSFIIHFQKDKIQQNNTENIANTSLLKKGKYSYYYTQKEQITILVITVNFFGSIAYLWFFHSLIENKNNMSSRTVDIIIWFSDIVYFQYLFDHFSSLSYMQILYVALTIIRVFSQTACTIGRVFHYGVQQRYRELIQALAAYVFCGFIPYFSYPLIMLVFIRDDMKDLAIKGKISQGYYNMVHIQLLSALIYLPVLKIFFGKPDVYPFNEFNYEWTIIAVWVYMALMYQISFRFELTFALRKGKYWIYRGVYDYLRILKGLDPDYQIIHSICFICYVHFEDDIVEKKIISGECRHNFHEECVEANKFKKCPIDKCSL